MPPSKTDEKTSDTNPRQVCLDKISCAHAVLVKLSDQQFDGATAEAILTLRKWAYPHCLRFAEARNAFLSKVAKKVEGEADKWTLSHDDARTLVPKLNMIGEELVSVCPEIIGILPNEKLRMATLTPNELESLSIFY